MVAKQSISQPSGVLKNFIFRVISSVGSEHLPYKQRVASSNLASPTIKRLEYFRPFLFYPEDNPGIFLSKEINGDIGNIVMKAAHRNINAALFWFIDQEYAGQTKGEHQIAVQPEQGNHVLTITDKKGNSISRSFDIAGK